MLGELQALGLYAGANALIVGNYLTTKGREASEDLAMLEALGMPIADSPGEGRFIIDARGSHSLPAKGDQSVLSGLCEPWADVVAVSSIDRAASADFSPSVMKT